MSASVVLVLDTKPPQVDWLAPRPAGTMTAVPYEIDEPRVSAARVTGATGRTSAVAYTDRRVLIPIETPLPARIHLDVIDDVGNAGTAEALIALSLIGSSGVVAEGAGGAVLE